MKTKQRNSAVDLTDLAIGIVVLGIVVSIGAYILITARDSRLTDLPEVTTTNETIGDFGTVSSATLDNSWVNGVTTVYNESGAIIPSGNYTLSIDSVTGVGTIANTTTDYPYSWNVTYTWYNTSQVDWALYDDAATGIGEFGDWFKIITIIGVAAVVLSLIFMAFGRRGDSTSY